MTERHQMSNDVPIVAGSFWSCDHGSVPSCHFQVIRRMPIGGSLLGGHGRKASVAGG